MAALFSIPNSKTLHVSPPRFSSPFIKAANSHVKPGRVYGAWVRHKDISLSPPLCNGASTCSSIVNGDFSTQISDVQKSLIYVRVATNERFLEVLVSRSKMKLIGSVLVLGYATLDPLHFPKGT